MASSITQDTTITNINAGGRWKVIQTIYVVHWVDTLAEAKELEEKLTA